MDSQYFPPFLVTQFINNKRVTIEKNLETESEAHGFSPNISCYFHENSNNCCGLCTWFLSFLLSGSRQPQWESIAVGQKLPDAEEQSTHYL